MKTLLGLLCVLAAGVIQAATGTNVVRLPAWEVPAGWERVSHMDSSREGRFFMDESLPALLSRTLVLDVTELPKDGIRWILTGPRAGLTVEIRPGSVELLARCYDSFGLHPEGTTNFARFPETKRSLCRVRTEAKLKSVTLTLDHRASVELSLNGGSVFRGTFVEDVSRHQLQIPGEIITLTDVPLGGLPEELLNEFRGTGGMR